MQPAISIVIHSLSPHSSVYIFRLHNKPLPEGQLRIPQGGKKQIGFGMCEHFRPYLGIEWKDDRYGYSGN